MRVIARSGSFGAEGAPDVHASMRLFRRRRALRSHHLFEVASSSTFTVMAIKTAKGKKALSILEGKVAKALPADIEKRARIRLAKLDAAASLDDLKEPGLKLHALIGDRRGFWSIRINDQWRIVFVWRDGDAFDVEIVDYH